MDNLVNKKITAIIPARGGSKRIPKKNIIPLNGKPMIAWTIEAALKSKYIEKVIVSTDDMEIAKVSRAAGANVPFLRDKKADDHAPISLATIRAVEQMEEHGMQRPDIVVQLMANCPLRDTHEIDKALENFGSKKIDFQISCFKYGWMNPWWAHIMDENGLATRLFQKEDQNRRSQDQQELYCPTGAIWIANTGELFRAGSFYGPGYHFFPMPWEKAIDIDDYSDLEMAKTFL